MKIKELADLIDNFDWSPVAIDKAHGLLLFGTILSYKPSSILELGIGSGFVTSIVLSALKYNGKGSLICVDSWHDWNGIEPPHIENLRKSGANIVVSSESSFVSKTEKEKYDLIIADGDHRNSHMWAEKTYELAKKNGILFFHDVTMSRYPGLRKFKSIAEERGYSHFLFNTSSLEEEMCERGWLMVRKDK